MEIRDAKMTDLNGILKLISNFIAESKSMQEIMNADDMVAVAKSLISGGMFLLALENDIVVGGLGGTFSFFPMDRNKKIFQEILFYMSPNYRKYSVDMIKLLEDRCQGIGINYIIMADIRNIKADVVDRFYSIQGYRRLEVQYYKKLKAV